MADCIELWYVPDNIRGSGFGGSFVILGCPRRICRRAHFAVRAGVYLAAREAPTV